MGSSHDGALGITYKVVRVLQAVCLIAIIGMTANFISDMVESHVTPPQVLVGTISVMCIATLYCAITFILYLDGILPFLVCAGMDGLHLIAVIVVAIVVGKPLSYLNCNTVGKIAEKSGNRFTTALVEGLNKNGVNLGYAHWIGTSKAYCLEMKSIWGLSIALCILFALSASCTIFLWRQSQEHIPKDIEN
ncbi:hypothetical protein AJ79_05030 [Helicocarpus griseus UAMH5409]|uniref:MARVEL domain-containing protein n=1 Tax=Helicocarpus griseus UAMH5409 TaxID=1447875 RepID=A0A2B7XRG3_9EURO|nr:hypothetical protein AJ79_05030 [Helicocarpus griseus UAMH5409]